jgi:molybdate transport system permease protein
MSNSGIVQVVLFSCAMAALACVLIIPIAVPLGWLLARKNWPGKTLLETLVALPLVLPPVATGLILLKLGGRKGPLGALWERVFESDLAFTWRAVVMAMAVMAFPLLVRACRIAFSTVDPRLEDIARTLGRGPFSTWFSISLPLAAPGLIGGMVLAFARALGEFGATIMVAGNIPGETATLALEIYSDIQLGNDQRAFLLLGISIVLAFGAVWLSEYFHRRAGRSIP